jgi:hypothetical protein
VVSAEDALVELLHFLRQHRYRFTAVTPATHRIILERACPGRPTLPDIFGWNRPFASGDLEPQVRRVLEEADALETDADGRLRSRFRVASLGDNLFLHSSFPTDDPNSVFFGPDTYRFVRFIQQQRATLRDVRHITDMGAGSGAGGIAAALLWPEADITLVDLNRDALRLAAINAEAAMVPLKTVASEKIPAGGDLVIANPPYLVDASLRTYRDGQGRLGEGVTLDWTRQAIARLGPGGVMLLYTGAAFENGDAPLVSGIADECRAAGADLIVDEIDPDVFGEELANAPYGSVERIAALGVRITVAA